MTRAVCGVVLTTADLMRAAPQLYRRMVAGWLSGGNGYAEHRPSAFESLLTVRFAGERWEDLLPDGTADEVDQALWDAASFGVDSRDLVLAIRSTWKHWQ